MVFSSTVFLFLFLPAIILVYYNPWFTGRIFKNSVLLVGSLCFYAWGEPLFVFIMLFSIGINYVLGLSISSRKHTKTYLIIGILWNIGLLFVFKYLGFFISTLCSLRLISPLTFHQISLPIGISFFTFQILSYLFDVYYKKVPVQKNIFHLTLYVCFFPQLIAGPIIRYSTIENQILHRTESSELRLIGFERFTFGLAKKCLLANYAAIIADTVFNCTNLNAITISDMWLGAIFYSFQIYFDFSGYSDMAIGLGMIFGFQFEENFNYPYMAKSITDFWRRWHISLSSWFRDYIYIPLGGNRCSFFRRNYNLFVVWFLTGLWHGANWTFIAWGIYYWLLLVIEKKWVNLTKMSFLTQIVYRLVTLFLILVGWIIFRSDSLTIALVYVAKLFGFCSSPFPYTLLRYTSYLPLLIFCIVLSTPIVLKLDWVKKGVTPILFILSVISCVSDTYSPFIYFNF